MVEKIFNKEDVHSITQEAARISTEEIQKQKDLQILSLKMANSLNRYYKSLLGVLAPIYQKYNKFEQLSSFVNANSKLRQALLNKGLKADEVKITAYLKKGYFLINEIAEAFRGQKILYAVAYDTGERVIEVKVPIEEILKMVAFEHISSGKMTKLGSESINIGGLRFRSISEKALEQLSNQKQYQVNQESNSQERLWYDLNTYVTQNRENLGRRGVKKLNNKGVIYETYVLYRARYNQPYMGPSSFNIDEMANLIIESSGNDIWYSGGDVKDIYNDEDLQAKLLNDRPGLASLNSILKIVRDMITVLRSFGSNEINIDELYKFFEDRFTQNKADEITENVVNKMTEKEYMQLENALTKGKKAVSKRINIFIK